MSSPLAPIAGGVAAGGAAAGGVSLRIKVVPGAAKDRIAGLLGDHLKVQITAPAEGGRANAAVIELLAAAFGLPVHAVAIRHGHRQARKCLVLSGLDHDEATARLTRLLAAPRQ